MKQGYLYIETRSGSKSTWTKKWIIATDENILIYLKRDDRNPSGNLKKSCFTKVEVDDTQETPTSSNDDVSIEYSSLNTVPGSKLWSIFLEVKGEGAAANHVKRIHLGATNKEERDHWVTNIEYKSKPMKARLTKKPESEVALVKMVEKPMNIVVNQTRKAEKLMLDEPNFDEIISKAIQKSIEDLKYAQLEMISTHKGEEVEISAVDEQTKMSEQPETSEVAPVVETSNYVSNEGPIKTMEKAIEEVKKPKRFIVKFKYNKRTESEMSLEEGEVINALATEDELYVKGSTETGKSGWFPVVIAEETNI